MRNDIVNIIKKLNTIFNDELISTDIDEYVNKIIKNASIITLYENEMMCGFIAFYNNDVANKNAFITMIAINPLCQGKGFSEMLLKFSIDKLKLSNYKQYSLEVLKSNEKAISLYKKNGFNIFQETDTHYKMILEL